MRFSATRHEGDCSVCVDFPDGPVFIDNVAVRVPLIGWVHLASPWPGGNTPLAFCVNHRIAFLGIFQAQGIHSVCFKNAPRTLHCAILMKS